MPGQYLSVPEFEYPRFKNCQQMNEGRSTALRTSRLYPQGKYSRYLFLLDSESNFGSQCDRKFYTTEDFQ